MPNGYAITNSHVVKDSDTAEIRTNDDKTYTAKIIGKDAVSDLALKHDPEKCEAVFRKDHALSKS